MDKKKKKKKLELTEARDDPPLGLVCEMLDELLILVVRAHRRNRTQPHLL